MLHAHVTTRSSIASGGSKINAHGEIRGMGFAGCGGNFSNLSSIGTCTIWNWAL
jgi:hypothetical protein